ncbi:uncharacterized protein SCODWIG_03094 [Saccharomycodes ludwigii]|uniref:CFEM domain-containing protein n=1 Tax=Saccharomycodes ludwigii TaxID=36035 RepID=A0A376B9H1_9ASCO|nr:uncharacterized protein SCODWIG_03094 [Saccharomycodes ludwigii]
MQFGLVSMLSVAFMASQVVVATPPACLLACVAQVNKQSTECSSLNDASCICDKESSSIQSCLKSICPNGNADAAYSSFQSSCSNLGFSVGSVSSASSSAASSSAASSSAASSSAASSSVASSSVASSSVASSSVASSSVASSSVASSSATSTEAAISTTFTSSANSVSTASSSTVLEISDIYSDGAVSMNAGNIAAAGLLALGALLF